MVPCTAIATTKTVVATQKFTHKKGCVPTVLGGIYGDTPHDLWGQEK